MIPSLTARPLAFLAVLALSIGACSQAPPTPGPTPTPTAIPTPAPRHISVLSFSVSRDMTTATIGLAGADGIVATEPGDAATVADGMLVLPLHLIDTGAQVIPVELGVPGGRLEIQWYPPIVYSKIGIQSGGTVLLFTTYPRGPNPDRSEPAGDPADATYSETSRWADARYVGDVPSATGTVADQLLELYRLFDVKNATIGVPHCNDDLTPIDTFWCMHSGAGTVWCSGFAKITRGFLRSTGTPARLLGLDAAVGMNGDVLVQTSEGHASTEVWTGDHWAWLDPTFRILRATHNGYALNLNQAIELLSNESTRDTVTFTREAAGSWVTQPYAELPETFRDSLARYISSDKLIVATGQ